MIDVAIGLGSRIPVFVAKRGTHIFDAKVSSYVVLNVTQLLHATDLTLSLRKDILTAAYILLSQTRLSVVVWTHVKVQGIWGRLSKYDYIILWTVLP